MRIVSDVLLLSYFDKFGLSVTVEAGQALAVLYSEARLAEVSGTFLLIYFGTLGDGYSLKGSNTKPSRHSRFPTAINCTKRGGAKSLEGSPRMSFRQN